MGAGIHKRVSESNLDLDESGIEVKQNEGGIVETVSQRQMTS